MGVLSWGGLLLVESLRPLDPFVYANIALSIVSIPIGFGLLKKKLFGLVLYDIYLVCWCVGLSLKYLRNDYNDIQLIVGLLLLVLNAVYVNKRIHEFR